MLTSVVWALIAGGSSVELSEESSERLLFSMNTTLRQFGDIVRTLRYVLNSMCVADLLIAGEVWYILKHTEHNLLSRGITPPPE